ncbi:MAG: four helix bundle protein [Deltaproteobacteria bacterium]|nr:four helix bundle protein [Deltaproteobacteria bacterium]
MKVQKFEDLEVWREARILVSEVYRVARENGRLAKDYRFRDQITAAALSVMSNIAEGFSRRTNREFAQFLFIAKGSCAEVQSLLYVALDQDYLNQEKFNSVYNQADLVARRLSRFISYLLRRTQQTQQTQETE